MTQWFRRFTEVPGLSYTSSPKVDRRRMPGWNAVPQVIVDTLLWPSPDGETSASPAHQWETEPRPGETTAQTALRQLFETLELPGEIEDYHFALQHCIEQLWKQRRAEPWIWEEMERLCWLNIHLVEAFPAPFVILEQFVFIRAFAMLVRCYEAEGYLREALEVAERGARLGQTDLPIDALRQRIRQLEDECA
jgi:hypothetical protein